jgi:hypothetical protein
MSKNRATLIVLAVISAAGIFTFFSLRQEAQDSRIQSKNQTDGATVIQLGVMTDREKLHSKAFAKFGDGRKIIDLLKTQDEISLVRGRPLIGEDPSTPAPTLQSFLKNTICSSDAVVTGKVVSKSSQLTSEGDFVFTDYVISVETIAKNNKVSEISPAKNIVVALPGGKVKLNGHFITISDQEFHPFKIGSEYLLFLKLIPGSIDYTSLTGSAALSESDGKLDKAIGESAEALFEDSNFNDVLKLVKAISTSNDCSQK